MCPPHAPQPPPKRGTKRSAAQNKMDHFSCLATGVNKKSKTAVLIFDSLRATKTVNLTRNHLGQPTGTQVESLEGGFTFWAQKWSPGGSSHLIQIILVPSQASLSTSQIGCKLVEKLCLSVLRYDYFKICEQSPLGSEITQVAQCSY